MPNQRVPVLLNMPVPPDKIADENRFGKRYNVPTDRDTISITEGQLGVYT